MKVSNLFNRVRLASKRGYQQVEAFHSAQNLVKFFIGLAIIFLSTPSIAQDKYPEHFRLKNMEDGSYLTHNF